MLHQVLFNVWSVFQNPCSFDSTIVIYRMAKKWIELYFLWRKYKVFTSDAQSLHLSVKWENHSSSVPPFPHCDPEY